MIRIPKKIASVRFFRRKWLVQGRKVSGLADTSGADYELEVRNSSRWRKRACGFLTGGNRADRDEVGIAQSTLRDPTHPLNNPRISANTGFF